MGRLTDSPGLNSDKAAKGCVSGAGLIGSPRPAGDGGILSIMSLTQGKTWRWLLLALSWRELLQCWKRAAALCSFSPVRWPSERF